MVHTAGQPSNVPLEQALDICIDLIRTRQVDLETAVQRYPEWAGELRGLLQVALVAQETFTMQPPAALQAATFQHIASLADEKRSQPASQRWWQWFSAPLARVALVIFIALLVLSGVLLPVGANALPDEPLYSLKLGVEHLRITAPQTDLQRAQLYLELTELRVREIKVLLNQQRSISPGMLQRLGDSVRTCAAYVNRTQAPDMMVQLENVTQEAIRVLEQMTPNDEVRQTLGVIEQVRSGITSPSTTPTPTSTTTAAVTPANETGGVTPLVPTEMPNTGQVTPEATSIRELSGTATPTITVPQETSNTPLPTQTLVATVTIPVPVTTTPAVEATSTRPVPSRVETVIVVPTATPTLEPKTIPVLSPTTTLTREINNRNITSVPNNAPAVSTIEHKPTIPAGLQESPERPGNTVPQPTQPQQFKNPVPTPKVEEENTQPKPTTEKQ